MRAFFGCDISMILIVGISCLELAGDILYFLNMLKAVLVPRRLKYSVYI